MPGSPSIQDFRFDSRHHAHAVFIKSNTKARAILSALSLDRLPKGVISVSGGAKEFPDDIEPQTIALIKKAIVPVAYEKDLLVVDGGTKAGIMQMLGTVFDRTYNELHIIGGESDQQKLPLLGFAPEPKVIYPGVKRSDGKHTPLDPNHVYFVLIEDAQDWGEEVECMFAFLDHLARQRVPVVNLIANGGFVTIQEAFHAVERKRPIVILEGSQRAVEVIVAALDGASNSRLVALLRKHRIPKNRQQTTQAITWLGAISKYRKVRRFEFLTRPPEELSEIILNSLFPRKRKET